MLFIIGLSPKPIFLGCSTVSRDRSVSCQMLTISKETEKLLLLLWYLPVEMEWGSNIHSLVIPMSSLPLAHMDSYNTSPSQLHTCFESADVSFHCISNFFCTLLLHQGLQVRVRLIFSKADVDLNKKDKCWLTKPYLHGPFITQFKITVRLRLNSFTSKWKLINLSLNLSAYSNVCVYPNSFICYRAFISRKQESIW